jgi:prolipoprotein diacylglyceryltransferase
MLESSIALIAFGAVILYERRRPRTGFVTALALLLYGVFRFSIDFFRYYPEDEVVGMVGSARLVISQLLAATLVGAAGVIFVRLRKISLRSEGTSQHGVAHSDD